MNKNYDLEGKNKAVVVFKFFAALLITSSDFEVTKIFKV